MSGTKKGNGFRERYPDVLIPGREPLPDEVPRCTLEDYALARPGEQGGSGCWWINPRRDVALRKVAL